MIEALRYAWTAIWRSPLLTLASIVTLTLGIETSTSGSPKTLRAILDEDAERMSTIVRMVIVLALVALLLAVFDIYGVVALAASRRTREIGIRIALGATRPTAVRVVLSSGLRPIGWGLGLGLAMAAIAARATAMILDHTPTPIAANDPLLYLCVGLLVAGVGVVAMLAPAVQAAGADPVRALREG
jgi:ABC-type antimicrobial peptide transport system permease subunit